MSTESTFNGQPRGYNVFMALSCIGALSVFIYAAVEAGFGEYSRANLGMWAGVGLLVVLGLIDMLWRAFSKQEVAFDSQASREFRIKRQAERAELADRVRVQRIKVASIELSNDPNQAEALVSARDALARAQHRLKRFDECHGLNDAESD